MSKTNKKVPEIRFPGFAGDWEQRKVLDLLIQPVTDGPHETPELVEEGIPFISVDAIVDNKIDFSRKRGNISEEYDELCCKKYKPQLHDVYLVKSGSTVGKVAIVETTERFNIWSPLAAMRCGDRTHPYFLYDLLQTKELQAQVADKASNGTQPNLSMRELEKFPVRVPSNHDEQKKIGEYFKNLDNLITLHQRKCEQLGILKKSMLQKMFPKKGETVPEIRFPGFTDDWERRKFEDIFAVSQGLQIPISERYLEPDSNRYFYITNEFLKENCETSYFIENPSESVICDEDDILMTRTGNTGIVVTDVEGCFHNNFFKIKYDKKNFHKRYLVYLLSSSHMQKIILNSAGSSTIPDLSHKAFYKINGMFPTSYDEQKKIGEYFYNLDNFITLHQRKCDQLKELKKSMLQKMFV